MPRLMVPLICTILLTSASPLAAATDPDSAAPLLAVAVVMTDSVLVEWVPGITLPDYYAIYGDLADGATTLLTTTLPDETGARVPVGFSQYHVAAVTGTTESTPVIALNVNPACIYLNLGDVPPSVTANLDCHVAVTTVLVPAGTELGVKPTDSESDVPEGASLWANVTVQDSKACTSWVDGEDPTTGTDEGCE